MSFYSNGNLLSRLIFQIVCHSPFISYVLTHSLTSIYSRRYLLGLHCFCSLSSLVVNCSHIQDASSLFIFVKISFLLQFFFKPSGCVICIPHCMVVYSNMALYIYRGSVFHYNNSSLSDQQLCRNHKAQPLTTSLMLVSFIKGGLDICLHNPDWFTMGMQQTQQGYCEVCMHGWQPRILDIENRYETNGCNVNINIVSLA